MIISPFVVSVGWGWHSPVGNFSDGQHRYMRDNLVQGNHIHDSMQLLFDGGDIYTLGSQPGSEISFNWVHGHHNCEKTNALYHDDGSGHFSDHHNVVQLEVGLAAGRKAIIAHPCTFSIQNHSA